MKNLLFGIVALLIVACVDTKKDPQEIIDAAIAAHGGEKFNGSLVSFTFRNKKYSVERYGNESTYTREFTDSTGRVKDILYNSSELTRFVNDTIVELSEEWEHKYKESVNSVLYFFQLPYGLNDPAVKKEYLDQVYIFDDPYDKVKVTFEQANGGTDYQDVFIYWIHRDKHTVDYLAYSYQTDGGGTRFRQAINRRRFNGILVQDYVNYKGEVKNLPVEKHDEYFEKGKLLELSRIVNEDVRVVN